MSFKEYTVKVFENGTKYWYLNGKIHREDGPAVEYDNGDKHWFFNAKRHREDGPAVEFTRGGKEGKEWWLNNREYTEEEFLRRTRGNSCDGKIVEIDGVRYQLNVVG